MIWCSLHAYYERPDQLLSSCVAPLVASLKARELVRRFFFLRYWERGFHVRLRILSPDASAAAAAREEICRHLQEHMARSPSVRSLDEATYASVQRNLAELEGLPARDLELAPNDSVAIERYEPEYGKYGGERGIEIAEELFDRSAECALMSLPTLDGREAARLGLGFTMMMLALRHFGAPPDRMAPFLDRYREIWSAYQPLPVELAEQRSAKMREQLLPRARAILSGEVPQHPALRGWADAVRGAARSLEAHADDVLSQVSLTGDADARRASLLVHYIHTHNNRLGLFPTDEVYLAFLGSSVVKALA